MTKFSARRSRTIAALGKFGQRRTVLIAGLCTLLIGVSLVAVSKFPGRLSRSQPHQANLSSAAISSLLSLPANQRAAALATLAQQGNELERKQARYLLAMDLIQQRQGEKAIPWLAGLEQNYPVLAADIIAKRAQAYTLAGNQAQAQATWQELLQRYPEQPEATEALYALGKSQPKYWDQAIARFPAHPRTVEIVQTRLKQNPHQPKLLLLLAKHALYLPQITTVLDQLTTHYKDQLQPEDWQAIAFGYWEKQEYRKAGAAYTHAPQIPLNGYRAGRGLQLAGQEQAALNAYQQMVAQFPKAKETPTALIKMASLTDQPKLALEYLELAIQISPLVSLPEVTGEALLAKAELLNRLNNPQAAANARQQLLTTYSSSDAAAELRWSQAEKRAAAQDFAGAKQLAWQIANQNPDSEQAPEATFWAGKWASRLGLKAEVDKAFKQIWADYPGSYYAWRAAALSGWPVGDFTTVRYLNPQVNSSPQRLTLPAGSAALKALYQLGQDREAWQRWQWEFQDRMQPTMAEQLTDGLMRLGVGDNLDGIFMIDNLKARSHEQPEYRDLYQAWQQQPGYRQALYPLPFIGTMTSWSQQRGLNPLLTMALVRQESRFEPTIRSITGAVGLMQVMPETGKWIAQQIQLRHFVLDHPNDNVNLGTWYLDYTHRTYNDNSMLAIASYNAGPGNVADWVEKNGLGDPDEFVEAIPFPETKDYVKAVLENYWNYLQLYNPETSRLLQQQF